MKKYLFIDTWNGEGYSESKAFVEELKNDTEANLRVLELVKENMPENGCMQILNVDYSTDWCKAMGFVKEPAELIGYQYTDEEEFEECENSGSIICVDWAEDSVGVIVSPNVNDYQVIRTEDEWKQVIDTVKELSEEYKEEELIYGTCHHDMDNGNDWILFEKSDLEEEKLPHQKSDFSEQDLEAEYEFLSGDGITNETWEHKETKKTILIQIDTIRYFEDKRL